MVELAVNFKSLYKTHQAAHKPNLISEFPLSNCRNGINSAMGKSLVLSWQISAAEYKKYE